jgi:uncharacterized protein YlxW (UPF0749 family)
MLQKQNNNLESILRTQAKEFQNLSNQITYMNKRLDSIKSESSTENATLEYPKWRHLCIILEIVTKHTSNS